MYNRIVHTESQARSSLSKAGIPEELHEFFIKRSTDGRFIAEIGAAESHLKRLVEPDPVPRPKLKSGQHVKPRKSPWLAGANSVRKRVNGETMSQFICRLINKGATNFEIELEVLKVFDKKTPPNYADWYRWKMRKKGTMKPIGDFRRHERPQQWGIYKDDG